MIKSAMIIGATGLVGREIVKLLLCDTGVKKVTTFVRRPSELKQFDTAGKMQEHLVDFERVANWAPLLKGDTLFSAMGTTLKLAGSEEAQYKVDYQYQWDVAHAARQNGCQTYVLISAAGANSESPFFYQRTKGELEDDIGILSFPASRILRPGLLKGNRIELRGEKRTFEDVANHVLDRAERVLPKVLFPMRFKPIPVETVARAAVNASLKSHVGCLVFGPDELWQLGSR
jgi:uncharacterized protein YbjT (DUF2867 family)